MTLPALDVYLSARDFEGPSGCSIFHRHTIIDSPLRLPENECRSQAELPVPRAFFRAEVSSERGWIQLRIAVQGQTPAPIGAAGQIGRAHV